MASEKKLAQEQRFGRWILKGLEHLGKGGNGVVWCAEDVEGANVAIKFLHRHHFGTSREKRFRDEIEFMRKESDRPGILPLVDANMPETASAENRPWFATPLATPFTKLQLAGAAQLEELVQRMEKVALTLAALHDGNIWHRDLKPDNLFILKDSPVIGDFGLVDFPDKEPVTESGEIMGPLFYVAPEMMENAAHKPAGPADVYSLAKTLWVLATGQRYPLPGELRLDGRALRLSTYCPHPRSHILDAFIERATHHEPSRRPTMRDFAEELFTWLKEPVAASLNVDFETLAKEYQSVFEPGNRAQREREVLIQAAQAALESFNQVLKRIAEEVYKVTNMVPHSGNAYDLPKHFESVEALGGVRVEWRGAKEISVKTGDWLLTRLQSFAQAEALDNDTIRVVAGHIICQETQLTGTFLRPPVPWSAETVALRGSAQLENEIEDLKTGLLANLPAAIRVFAEKVKERRR